MIPIHIIPPRTYIINKVKRKQSEEEIIEEVLPTARPLQEDESTTIPYLSSNQDDGHVIKSSTISPKQYENIQLIEGTSNNNGGHSYKQSKSLGNERNKQYTF